MCQGCSDGTAETISIGSGSAVPLYTDYINKLTAKENMVFQQMATDNIDGQGAFIAQSLSDLLSKAPTEGISSLFQIFEISRGERYITNHEYEIFLQDGKIEIIRFPKFLATNFQEFDEFCKQKSANAYVAIA